MPVSFIDAALGVDIEVPTSCGLKNSDYQPEHKPEVRSESKALESQTEIF